MPDPLFRKAKSKAAERGQTLHDRGPRGQAPRKLALMRADSKRGFLPNCPSSRAYSGVELAHASPADVRRRVTTTSRKGAALALSTFARPI